MAERVRALALASLLNANAKKKKRGGKKERGNARSLFFGSSGLSSGKQRPAP